jgi:TRAP-type C4-dicarboxylate transport system substrate-binding protein
LRRLILDLYKRIRLPLEIAGKILAIVLGIMMFINVNTGVWNSLLDAEKKIVKDGAMEGARVERAAWLEAEIAYEKQAGDSGSIITELTPEQHNLFEDALAPLYQQPAYTSYNDIIRRVRETQ